MTIAEVENFYGQDLKKYELLKNKELLTWLGDSIKNGYHSFFDIESLQELVDNIVYWYEIKYPEREMEAYEGPRYFEFEEIAPLSKVMDLQQLMYRLPHNQSCLLKGDYRGNGGGIRKVYNDKGEIVGHKTVLFIGIDRKGTEYNPVSMCGKSPSFLLYADTDSGIVNSDNALKDYVAVNNNNITLDELLTLFKEKYADELDFTKLEECIYDHNCDIELRRHILQSAALKLLYSRRTIPERGYERAKRFINECNEKWALNLSTEEVDEVINRDYTNKKRENQVLKADGDKENKKHTFWTIEGAPKREQKLPAKAKNLVKLLLKK